MEILKVVAGVIEKDKKFLIARKAKGKSMEGKWEFPGGKVEDGETNEEALKREFFEEFNVEIKVNGYLTTSEFLNDKKKFI